MTEHSDNRRERREDLVAAITEALPDALDRALPPALAKALPAEMERSLWGDMRPARKWAEIRAYLETSIKDHETKVRRLEGLKKQSFELGSSIAKDILIHIIVSTVAMGGIIGLAWKFVIQGAVK